jgi:cytochrome c oxidase cbb3-type subunit I/II
MSTLVEKRVTFDDAITRRFVFASVGWGVVGMLVGLIAALQMVFPALNLLPELTFGRLRPLHTNAVIFAFVGNMMFGGVYYSTQRLLKSRMGSDTLSKIHFYGWQLIIVAAALTLPLGITQGKEYAELEWPIDIAIAGIWVVFAVNFFWTLAIRREKHLYVAIWFYIATIVTVAVLHIVNSLSLPLTAFKSYSIYAGVQDALVQWWYGHNAVAFFLTTPILGIMYYFVPKATGRPVYSYRLSIVHFWALVFLYIWAGPHHLLYTALPAWAQTLGMVFSLMLWAPSWGGMINGLLTIRGAWDRLREDPVIKFFAAAITFYGMATFEGPLLSIKSVNGLAHYTDWIVGHVHSGALGWNGLMAAGMFYWLVPKLFGTKLHSRAAANAHFWLATLGILFYMASMWAAGVTQALMLRAQTAEGALLYPDFIETVVAIRWLYLARALGGGMYLVGFIIMAWNLIVTAKAGKAVDGEITVVEEAKEEGEPTWLQILVSRPVVLAVLGTVAMLGLGLTGVMNAILAVAILAGVIVVGFATSGKPDAQGRMWHRVLEGRGLIFSAFTVVAVLVGGIVELVPTVVIGGAHGDPAKNPPYRALELEGRDIYVSEGCYTCHSQMIRPMVAETQRYGAPSTMEDSGWDHPFQWGSKRTGPDLAREGGKYPNLWHLEHMTNPRSVSAKSVMPEYAWMRDRKVDFAGSQAKLSAMRTLGVPYKPEQIAGAAADARAQADEIVKDLAKSGQTVAADSQMVALISYLQRLGKPPAASAPAVPPVALTPLGRRHVRLFLPHHLRESPHSAHRLAGAVPRRVRGHRDPRAHEAGRRDRLRRAASARERRGRPMSMQGTDEHDAPDTGEPDTGHEYDGIRELDHPLPRWWLITFYGTVGFALIYFFHYEVFRSGLTPTAEWEAAREAQEIRTGGDKPPTTEQLMSMSKSAHELEEGKATFLALCGPCHGERAEGKIGPNLTDKVWLHGGSADDVYKTVATGVPDKGMPAWKSQLGRTKTSHVVAYVLSVRNTNVPGKEAQGTPYDGPLGTRRADWRRREHDLRVRARRRGRFVRAPVATPLAKTHERDPMLVTQLMAHGALCVREDDTLLDAVGMMSRHDVGGLPVRGPGGVVGVISKTDVLDRLAEGRALDVRVRDAMSSPALTVSDTATVEQAVRVMVDEGIHRVVVVDDEGGPVGVLTPWDVLRAVADGRLTLSQ